MNYSKKDLGKLFETGGDPVIVLDFVEKDFHQVSLVIHLVIALPRFFSV